MPLKCTHIVNNIIGNYNHNVLPQGGALHTFMTSKKAIPPVHHCLPESIPIPVTILAGHVYKHSVTVIHRLAGNNNHIHRPY